MKIVKIHIPKANLVKSVGKGYIELLNDLIAEGALLSFNEVLELRFEKDKARHIQSTLEFHDVQELPQSPKSFKQED